MFVEGVQCFGLDSARVGEGPGQFAGNWVVGGVLAVVDPAVAVHAVHARLVVVPDEVVQLDGRPPHKRSRRDERFRRRWHGDDPIQH